MTVQNLAIWPRLQSGSWLTRDRALGYLRLLAIANLIGLALAICRGTGWLFPPVPHFSTEFLSFYAAGRLAAAGHAALVYAPGIPAHAYIASFHVPPGHQAMERALSHDPQVMYFSFFYPPVFWLLCAPLSLLAYYRAYLLWVGLSGALLWCCLRQLAGGWLRAWPALAYLAITENAAVGENAFLSTALVGFGLLNLGKRPLLAGACFGALCYKPNFVLPVLLLLLAGRHLAALVSAAFTGTALCLLSAVLFGWRNWLGYFLVTVPHAQFLFTHGGFSYALMVTPGSAVRLLGGGGVLAAVVQAGGMLFAAYCIYATRRASFNVRAAMFAASFPMLLTVMLSYDLTMSGLAILYMLREVERTAYLPWEKTALAAMFALPLVTEVFRTQMHIPLDPLITLTFMALLLRRAGPVAMFATPPMRPLQA
ncbi:glycosyltransferase family 87 protein [Acidocella sp.]|uniref:glycosyltransferase family 87 protein n=1 Tax=Acidocella sp. TaxID=50710 RepID=UPI0017E12DF9|nr:glycosyltransferase family 87 protein [Acidocella sp.]NNM57600.1 DUF2029 domain-containing protein [Acidocella sp.]